jgi:hypothetical protein
VLEIRQREEGTDASVLDRLSVPLAMALLDEDTPERSRTTLNALLRDHLAPRATTGG